MECLHTFRHVANLAFAVLSQLFLHLVTLYLIDPLNELAELCCTEPYTILYVHIMLQLTVVLYNQPPMYM